LSPLLILLCVLLALAELIIHQPFHVMMRNEDLVSMAQAASRINCVFERMKNRSGFLLGIFTALLCILSLPLELMRKIASHSPRKETFSLLYIAIVSFLCLFSIAGLPWLMAIFMFFWYIVVRQITRFKPTARIVKSLQTLPKSEQMDNPVGRYFIVTVTSPLGMFHPLGGQFVVGFLLVYTAYNMPKMHLTLLFSIWGLFLWNTVMIEIQLYAKEEQKKTALLYGEDLY
jgi:hypothetical protein